MAKPTSGQATEKTIHEWIAYDCPPAGKHAIDQNLINLLVARIEGVDTWPPGNPSVDPPGRPEAPVAKPKSIFGFETKAPDEPHESSKPDEPVKPLQDLK